MNSKLRDDKLHKLILDMTGHWLHPHELQAIRQAVGEEMLELIDEEIEVSKKNLAYAEENNHSDRTIANWKGCIEGEMFCRQKIKEYAALKESSNEA